MSQLATVHEQLATSLTSQLTMAALAYASVGLILCLSRVQAASEVQQQRLAQADSNWYTAGAEADRVLGLPGLGRPDFGLFSGWD